MTEKDKLKSELNKVDEEIRRLQKKRKEINAKIKDLQNQKKELNKELAKFPKNMYVVKASFKVDLSLEEAYQIITASAVSNELAGDFEGGISDSTKEVLELFEKGDILSVYDLARIGGYLANLVWDDVRGVNGAPVKYRSPKFTMRFRNLKSFDNKLPLCFHEWRKAQAKDVLKRIEEIKEVMERVTNLFNRDFDGDVEVNLYKQYMHKNK